MDFEGVGGQGIEGGLDGVVGLGRGSRGIRVITSGL